MAQMPFSPCDDASACTDTSVAMLTRIFGPVIDALVTGADPNTVAASANILATMFGFFNSGILIIGSLIVSYVAVMGVTNTANDGEAMGKSWSSLWTPVRIVAGGAVLLPTTSGFSFIQLIVLMFALWGVGFANGVQKAGMAMGILSPNGIVQGVNAPGNFYGLRDFARQYLAASYCARAANSIYSDNTSSGSTPQVMANGTADKTTVTSGRTENTFYVKDRNALTNLAGGAPFCGTVKVASYVPQAQDDATAQAMEQLRANVQTKKVNAAVQMMAELDNWVNQWPASINDPGWDQVNSDKFNTIVNKWEEKVATDLVSQVTSDQGGVDNGLADYVKALTSSGWADAGGWFQRVGMVRGQISNILSESVGSVGAPSLSALPSDARASLLTNSVTTVTSAINKKSEEKASYKTSSTSKPEDLASLIPSDPKSDINPGSIKADMDAKMSSFVNRTMLDVVEIATGAGSNGQTPLCGTAGQMGGSLNRMKCVGDYLTVARAGIGVADVAIKTTATGLRVVAGALSSVKGVGTGLDLDKIVTPIWDWVVEVPIKQLALMASYIEPLAFYFGVFLPSLPYTIFMIVFAGWVLAVLQSVIAAPLWAVMHMTPDRTFVGSQTQGYLLLLSLFARPALAIIGLFAAVLISDPMIDYIAKGFFAMRGAVVSSTGTVGAIAEFLTFAWWFMVFGLTLLPVLYMTYGLPQVLPDHVLRWIGAGVGDLGETGALGQMRGGMAAVGSGIGGGRGSPTARIGGGRGMLPPPDGGGSPPGGPRGGPRGGGSGGGQAQILSSNPQGISPTIPEPSSPPAATNDSRSAGEKFSDGMGVALGRTATDGAAATGRAIKNFGNAALSGGAAGVDAFRSSDSSSLGGRLRDGVVGGALTAGAGIASAASAAGSDFKTVGETAKSEGKAAYAEGADSRIDSFKASLSGGSVPTPGGDGDISNEDPNTSAPGYSEDARGMEAVSTGAMAAGSTTSASEGLEASGSGGSAGYSQENRGMESVSGGGMAAGGGSMSSEGPAGNASSAGSESGSGSQAGQAQGPREMGSPSGGGMASGSAQASPEAAPNAASGYSQERRGLEGVSDGSMASGAPGARSGSTTSGAAPSSPGEETGSGRSEQRSPASGDTYSGGHPPVPGSDED